MKGSYRVYAKCRDIEYDFTLRRKITIVRGDSGTGKSTFCKILDMDHYERFIKCDVPLEHFVGINTVNGATSVLDLFAGSIVAFDSPRYIINYPDILASLLTGEYYTLIFGRVPLLNCPADEVTVCSMVGSKKHYLKELYTLTKTQLEALKELYPIAYQVYTTGGDLTDVQFMVDDIRKRYK